MQIEKLGPKYDHQRLLEIYNSLNNFNKQICITARDNPGSGHNDLIDGVGSIFKYQPAQEWDWNHIHPTFAGTYLEEVYEELSNHYTIGRMRFMVMDSDNRALTYHYDEGIRLHIPLTTNPHCWFIQQDETLYKMDNVGSLYVLDANQHHSALNLSRENIPRIHIVISAIKLN
jgi:hypothetical protein|tara:strand:+ start:596 stop:1114 length:519 start_codon:yes stop_codon:yes gene_type:complete